MLWLEQLIGFDAFIDPFGSEDDALAVLKFYFNLRDFTIVLTVTSRPNLKWAALNDTDCETTMIINKLR